MKSAAELAQDHWNATPLFLTEEARYHCYPWLYEAAEFTQHAGERVLEIGCGTGSDLLQFAKHGAFATGVDITDRHLELARARVQGTAEVQRADATSLPFPDAHFDYIYSHGVIHHSDRPALIAREIARVLKPKGRINIQLYALVSFATAAYILRHGTAWKRHIENSTDPVHIDLYTKGRVAALFPEFNLSFQKREIHRRFRAFEPWLGWFLIATGEKRVLKRA